MKERRALGMMLFIATIIPVSDMITVLGKSYTGFAAGDTAYYSDHYLFSGGHSLIDSETSNTGTVKKKRLH